MVLQKWASQVAAGATAFLCLVLLPSKLCGFQIDEYTTLPVVITSITPHLVDSTVVAIGQTRAWPGTMFYQTVSYIYEIRIFCTVLDSLYWREKAGIACRFSDGSMFTEPIASERLVIVDPHFFEYSFRLDIRKDGWVDCVIASIEDILTESHIRSFKRTSMKTPIYLKGPS